MYNRIVDQSLVHHPTSGSGESRSSGTVTSPIDQVQIALAIADESTLKTLLADCLQRIAPLHQIGKISSIIGVRTPDGDTVDAVLTYDRIHCIPADSDPEIEPFAPCEGKSANECEREMAHLTRCSSGLRTVVHHVSLSDALAALTNARLSPSQIHTIVNLPHDAWYKTWWYELDKSGEFSIPFHRRIRTRQYADGSVTIQYKDYYSYSTTKPICFSSQRQQVVVAIHRENQSFSTVLSSINANREQLGVDHALLICDRLSELEARGYLSQQVSLYTASDLCVYAHADCMICVNHDCPMHRRSDSPVVTCRMFCLGDSCP
ncbi:MAG: hypothetical protein VKL39_13440 [Leptolyngbyaceae bacterium]|nr:hypothetical protein [Leptolyngbyaceae bacterium]